MGRRRSAASENAAPRGPRVRSRQQASSTPEEYFRVVTGRPVPITKPGAKQPWLKRKSRKAVRQRIPGPTPIKEPTVSKVVKRATPSLSSSKALAAITNSPHVHSETVAVRPGTPPAYITATKAFEQRSPAWFMLKQRLGMLSPSQAAQLRLLSTLTPGRVYDVHVRATEVDTPPSAGPRIEEVSPTPSPQPVAALEDEWEPTGRRVTFVEPSTTPAANRRWSSRLSTPHPRVGSAAKSPGSLPSVNPLLTSPGRRFPLPPLSPTTVSASDDDDDGSTTSPSTAASTPVSSEASTPLSSGVDSPVLFLEGDSVLSPVVHDGGVGNETVVLPPAVKEEGPAWWQPAADAVETGLGHAVSLWKTATQASAHSKFMVVSFVMLLVLVEVTLRAATVTRAFVTTPDADVEVLPPVEDVVVVEEAVVDPTAGLTIQELYAYKIYGSAQPASVPHLRALVQPSPSTGYYSVVLDTSTMLHFSWEHSRVCAAVRSSAGMYASHCVPPQLHRDNTQSAVFRVDGMVPGQHKFDVIVMDDRGIKHTVSDVFLVQTPLPAFVNQLTITTDFQPAAAV